MKISLTFVGAITLLACGADTHPITAPSDPSIGIAISPSGLSLVVGDGGRFTARTFDSNNRTTSASLEWSSANPAVATVGKRDGIVTAISAGTTTVTAATGALSATATVSVRLPDPPVGVSISRSALGLIVGGVERLTARAYDSTGPTTGGSVEWTSANRAVVTVQRDSIVGTPEGVVTAISAGTTTVTATIGALRATATVSVVPLAGSFSFTRWTMSSNESWTSEALFYSVADGTIRPLPPPPVPRASQLGSIGLVAWSPDGTLLAFEGVHAYFAGATVEDFDDYNSDLYVVDAAAPATSTWRPLTANGLSKAPSWSPDGKRIAYLRQKELFAFNHIYIVDAAGGEPVRVTQGEGSYTTPSWSPDGTRLMFTDWNVGGGEVFIVNADGTGLTNVTRSSGLDFEPSWSPDGAHVAFVSSRGNTAGDLNVFVVDVDGSNVRQLTSRSDHSRGPVWSPDGGQILFSSGDAVYVMTAAGSSAVRLTTPPSKSVDAAPVWRR